MKIKGSSLFVLILVLIGSSFIALDENFRYLNLISECSEEEDKTETEVEVHKSLIIRYSRKANGGQKKVSHRTIAKQDFFSESVFSEFKAGVHHINYLKPINELYILYCSLKIDLV